MTATPAVFDALLATKLYAPRLRNFVMRGELMRQLALGARSPLTVVIAPAGYGKTTLLGAWYADLVGSGGAAAWLALDEGDNDVTRFLRYLVAALRSVAPSVGASVYDLLHSPPLPPVESLLTSLINDVDAVSNDLTLVLDDYHLIQSSSVHHVMAFLLQHAPPNLHLVIASRADLPLSLARLRARGQLVELRTPDLRFTQAETIDFLERIMAVRLGPDQVAQLQARTEGWIAGLQLAGLSLRSIQASADGQQRASERAEQFIAAFTGSHRYVVDYLIEEVLSREPSAIQQFLLHTSILERMCAELCEAVALDGESRAALDYLERGNLFLVPLDADRRWYRYHHLFAGVLRRRLAQLEPDVVAHLHRRASDWYERHSFVAEAVHHALQAADVDRVADLVEAHATQIGLCQGEINTVLSWIDALPAAVRQSRPLVNVHHAAILLLLGESETARPIIQQGVSALAAAVSALDHSDPDALYRVADQQIPDQLRPAVGQLASLQAIFALYQGDLDRVDALSQRALELIAQTDLIWHARAKLNSIWDHRLTGEAGPEIKQRLSEVVSSVRQSGQSYYPELATINLAHLYVLQGRMQRAVTTYEQALHELERGVVHTIIEMYAHLGLGEIAYELNELDVANQHLREGVRMLHERQGAHAEWSTVGYIALARVYAARGDVAQSRATLQALIELARQRGFVPELVEQAEALGAVIALREGDFETAAQWARKVATPHAGSAWPFRREQILLNWARIRIAVLSSRESRPADASAHLVHDALAQLDTLLRTAQSQNRMHRVVEILVVRALAASALNDLDAARDSLQMALRLAAPEGYIRVFADESAPMTALLLDVQARGAQKDAYLARLLAACQPATHGAADDAPLAMREPLSERELEILALLAVGRSTEEIATELVITVGTVKNHVKHILAKLGVHSRLLAVEHARALNLI